MAWILLREVGRASGKYLGVIEICWQAYIIRIVVPSEVIFKVPESPHVAQLYSLDSQVVFLPCIGDFNMKSESKIVRCHLAKVHNWHPASEFSLGQWILECIYLSIFQYL